MFLPRECSCSCPVSTTCVYEIVYERIRQIATDEHELTMRRSEVSFGDNHRDSQHRSGIPSIFRHRVGPDGNYMVMPIMLVDR